MLDTLDNQILTMLRDHGRISWVKLAKKVNLSPSACQRRVETMLANGVIKRFSVELDAEKMGRRVQAFIETRVERQNLETADAFRRQVAVYPEVRGFYKLSGNTDYLIKIAVTDIRALSDFLDKLLALDGVVDASSKIVLDELPCAY